MEIGFVMYVCNIKLCPEAYTSPTHLQKESNFVMHVYDTIQFCVEAYTTAIYLQMEWWLTSTVQNITFSGISVNIVIVLRLDHMQFFFLAEAVDLFSVQNIRPAPGTSGLLFSGCCGSFPSVEAADAWGRSLISIFCWGYGSVQL